MAIILFLALVNLALSLPGQRRNRHGLRIAVFTLPVILVPIVGVANALTNCGVLVVLDVAFGVFLVAGTLVVAALLQGLVEWLVWLLGELKSLF